MPPLVNSRPSRSKEAKEPRLNSHTLLASRLPSRPAHRPHCRDTQSFDLQNRPLLTRGFSSPLCNKQGNRIQVLRIPPFLACSLRSSFFSFFSLFLSSPLSFSLSPSLCSSTIFSHSFSLSRANLRVLFSLFPFACFLLNRACFLGSGSASSSLVERFIIRPPYHKHKTV